MASILSEIIASKRGELERARAARPLSQVMDAAAASPAPRDFYGAIADGPPGLRVIAEIKRRSPSGGLIRPDFDPVAIARAYAAGGAATLSVLTDAPYFDGRLEYLQQVRDAVALPALRKDFIIDAYQVFESRAAGADAILLIAEALDDRPIGELAALARTLGMTVLIEMHDEESLSRVMRLVGAPSPRGTLLGINNRDLRRQVVDLATTARLATLLPPGTPFVSESGIRTHDDVQRIRGTGARAVLIGETLVRSPDIAAAMRDLFRR